MLPEPVSSFIRRHNKTLFMLFCVAAFIRVITHAAVLDDAYITFRVIDNFFHGFGLRWNIDDRVQVYTHPLWMLLHIPFYPLFDTPYHETIFISVICGLLAVWLLAQSLNATPWHKAGLVILPLCLSRTFDQFVVSGLEIPLSFCLLAWLIAEWLRGNRYYRLCFIASLCVLVRFDNAVLIAPLLASSTWEQRRELRFMPLLAALSPLLTWALFSLFYYGFIWPNTAYAKVATGIAPSDYIYHGIIYLFTFTFYDSVGFALVAYALIVGRNATMRLWYDESSHKESDLKIAVLAIGIALNLLYVIRIGGDYQAGRFLANAVFISVAVVFFTLQQCSWKKLVQCATALLVLCGLQPWVITPATPDIAFPHNVLGISDFYAFYHPTRGLFSETGYLFRQHIETSYLEQEKTPESLDAPKKYVVNGFIGIRGFNSGYNVIIIDDLALADPLLARLPVMNVHRWAIGHFVRDVPAGYIHARETGDTSKMDPYLARYYEKLRLVTSGDLLSYERLKTIADFQLGRYDSWRDEYLLTLKAQ